MNVGRIYVDEVHENLKPLYANWEPNQPVNLGDFGVIREYVFIYLGNISAFNINFPERTDAVKAHKSFASQGSVEVKTHAKGSTQINGVLNVSAALEINFSSERSVFFNAAECSYRMIADKIKLGKQIMEKYIAGDWKREWAVITDLIIAGSTTIAVSGAKNAGLLLEAKGDVPQIELANAAVGFNVRNSTNVGYQVISKAGLIPLFGLCKIQSKFFRPWAKEFAPYIGLTRYGEYSDLLGGSSVAQAEEELIEEEELYFGQLR